MKCPVQAPAAPAAHYAAAARAATAHVACWRGAAGRHPRDRHFSVILGGPGQLKGGRFAEVLLRIYQHLLGEPVTPFGTDIVPREKTRVLNTIESTGTIDTHVRLKTVPQARLVLDFRNNRDVAHLGGFDANSMDALFVMTSATWIMCELIRVYGGYAMPEAQKIVDALSVREYPVIMERRGELFITRHDLKAKDEVLVLMMKSASATAELLHEKSGDSNKSRFQRNLREMVAKSLSVKEPTASTSSCREGKRS